MFSAYDLKKIIPRAIFALIAVNLSWSLMEIFIRAVEGIGQGAQELIMAPFADAGLVGISFGGGEGLAFSAIIVTAGAAAAIGIVPVLGVAVTGLFGLLFAFGIIMLRKVFLIGLIVIAPIAIALSVFPQTESWAKKWWDWFSKLMLMYPFITAMFGLSEVAAGIISRVEGSGLEKLVYQVGAAALLIAPYFLVGKALSVAGGAIGKVAGMVNNKDKGIIDKTKKWEGGKVAEKRNRFFSGTRMSGNGVVSRTVNRTGLALRDPKTLVAPTPERRSRAATARLLAGAASLETVKPTVKTIAGKDELALAATGSEDAANDRINALVAEAVGRGEDANAVRNRLVAARESVKQKAGGFSGTLAVHVMERAITEGAVTGAEAEENISRIAESLGGSTVVQAETAQTLMATVSGAIGKTDPLAGALQRRGIPPTGPTGAPVTRATATSAVDFDATINGMFTGEGALNFEDLGKIGAPAQAAIRDSKVAQVQDRIAGVGTAPTADAARIEIEQLIQHRADVRTAQAAAAKAGDTAATDAALETLRLIDDHVRQAEAAGVGISLDYVQRSSQSLVEERLKPI